MDLIKEEIIEAFLRIAAKTCDSVGGYSNFQSEGERQRIMKEIIQTYNSNGNLEPLSRIVEKIDNIVSSYMQELVSQGFRHYGWLFKREDEQLRKRLNTLLEEA